MAPKDQRPEKKMTEILHDESTQLGVLLKKVLAYNQLEVKLSDFIPSELSAQVRLGAYQKGVLTLFVNDASLGTQLTFRVPEMRDKLRSRPGWHGLRNIQVKIKPELETFAPTAPVDAPCNEPLSEQAKQALSQAAELLANDDDSEILKQALRKLAER